MGWGTSIECPECHHKDERNRLSQAEFECVRCHHIEHADVVGGANVRDRAFQKITEISPGTSLKNARLSKARKGQPAELMKHAEYLKNPPFTVGRL
jgi:transposase